MKRKYVKQGMLAVQNQQVWLILWPLWWVSVVLHALDRRSSVRSPITIAIDSSPQSTDIRLKMVRAFHYPPQISWRIVFSWWDGRMRLRLRWLFSVSWLRVLTHAVYLLYLLTFAFCIVRHCFTWCFVIPPSIFHVFAVCLLCVSVGEAATSGRALLYT